MVGKCLVIDESIFRQDGEVLADVIVQTYLILVLHHVTLAVGFIHVVTCLGIKLFLDDWGDGECIYTLRLVAYLLIDIAVAGVGIIEVVE